MTTLDPRDVERVAQAVLDARSARNGLEPKPLSGFSRWFRAGLLADAEAAIREIGPRTSRDLDPREREALDWLVGRLESADCVTPGCVYEERVSPTTVELAVRLPEGWEFAEDVVARESKVIESYVAMAIRTMLIQSGYHDLPLPVSLIPEQPSDEEASRLIREAAALLGDRVPRVPALGRAAYVASQPRGSGWTVSLGFGELGEAQDARDALVKIVHASAEPGVEPATDPVTDVSTSPEAATLVVEALVEAARELAQYASYAEIVGGVSYNRPQIRESCDTVFRALNAYDAAIDRTTDADTAGAESRLAVPQLVTEDGPRAYTVEEVRDAFLANCRSVAQYWAEAELSRIEPGKSEAQVRCEGAVFSILTTLDGGTHLPRFLVVPDPHPEDEAFRRDQGLNWYPPAPEGADATDLGGALHEHFYPRRDSA